MLGVHIKLCVTESPSGKNENGWKCPKNRVFGHFKKIMSLVLSGIGVKWKFVWFINIMPKLHAWEKSGSQVIAKNGSQPMEISVFFNHQYFIEWLVSDFDFWHVDRHEWKEQGLLTVFRKNSHLGKWAILGTKMEHPQFWIHCKNFFKNFAQ